jgi:DNA-binding CsgD family transcriptional regulator
MARQDGLFSFIHEDSLAGEHTGPGIMLLSASMRLLYKDGRAGELCDQIIRCQGGKTANGVLPPAVVSLANEIRNISQTPREAKDWEQFQLRRIVKTLHRPVLIYGMGLAAPNEGETRILIVINEIGVGAWQNKVVAQAKEKFNLTAREIIVVQNLLKGWTNKEIANEMGLAEQTVKEHCKHILGKTSTTTRTQLLMQLVDSGLCQEPATPSPHVVVPATASSPLELMASA